MDFTCNLYFEPCLLRCRLMTAGVGYRAVSNGMQCRCQYPRYHQMLCSRSWCMPTCLLWTCRSL